MRNNLNLLTPHQFLILSQLEEGENYEILIVESFKESSYNITKPNLRNILNRMQSLGYITSTVERPDGYRLKLYRIAPRGRRLLEKTRGFYKK